MKSKGEAGEYLCTHPPYGYRKDPDSPKKWLVDEEAAQVVKRIFALCLEGYGPTQIARILKGDSIPVPTVYWLSNGRKPNTVLPDNPCKWVSDTVAYILERKEYLGHTINFKTYKQSYKSKKKLWNPEEKQLVFENTHEAIILLIHGKRYRLCGRISAGLHGRGKPIYFPALPIVPIAERNSTIAPAKALKQDKTILSAPLQVSKA